MAEVRKVRCGVNGFGRVGRIVARCGFFDAELEIVHINELAADAATNAYLWKYDSAHGVWPYEVVPDGEDAIVVDGRRVTYSKERDPAAVGWAALGVEVVLECSGQFLTKAALAPFFGDGGCKKVVVSAACKDGILNVVYGCNHDKYDPAMDVVTAASCTTNCIAPVIKVVNETVGIVHGSITTMHCITNTQPLVDAVVGKKQDFRRCRSGLANMAPTSTNSATAIGMIYPELLGKLNGHAVRVPLQYASLTDLTFEVGRPTTAEEINAALKAAAGGELAGVLGYEELPLVSSDYRSDPRSGIVDALSTLVVDGTQLKLYVWYDNEFGYCNRMLDVAKMVGTGLRAAE